MKISTTAILSIIALTSAATMEGGAADTEVQTETTLATITSCASTVTECPGKASSAAGPSSVTGEVSTPGSMAPSYSNVTSPTVSSMEGGAAINGVSAAGLAALAAGFLCL